MLIISSSFATAVQELGWPKGESFLTFLEKYSIPQKFYFDLEKEDKELCSEIVAGQRYYLYENEDGTLNQVLIPISEDIQLHIYANKDGVYKFQALPINYTEYTETIAIPVENSVSYTLQKATGSAALAAQVKAIFTGVNFRRMQKGDFIAVKYSQKVLLGKALGFPDVKAAMVEINGKKHYRFKNSKDDKYYDQKGKAYTKTYFFKIPLSYKRISSKFTKKRWHPVLKKYRAHLGTDFAAPRGRKIYAAGDGRIEFKGWRGGYGKTIIIRHANGYKTLYAHQNKFRSGLKRGQRVRKGQHIGYVGNTGLSSGPHLHLGLYKNGRAVNPMKVIRRPQTKGLKGQAKRTFIANTKTIKAELDQEVLAENKNIATKLDRISVSSEITNRSM